MKRETGKVFSLDRCIKISLILFVGVSIFVVAEFLARRLTRRLAWVDIRTMVPASSRLVKPGGRILSPKRELYWENIRGKTVLESMYVNGRPLFEDIPYSFDGYGRRRTLPEGKGPAVLFFGPCMVLGIGVPDHQSLPSLFAAKAKGRRIYNYAVKGWGSQQFLQVLRSRNLSKEIASPIERFLFVIRIGTYRGHVHSLRAFYHRERPVYRIDEKTGRFTFRGMSYRNRPAHYPLYKFLSRSTLLYSMGIKPMMSVNRTDYRRYVLLLREIQRTLRQRYPAAKFHFVIHPASDVPAVLRLRQTEGYAGLPVLDYSDLVPRKERRTYYYYLPYAFPNDDIGDPRYALHSLLASRLYRDIYGSGR